MGLDTSAHPLDLDLLQTRIIPFILEGEPIDDLLDRAAAVHIASRRANGWGLALVDYKSALLSAQEEAAEPELEAYFAARKARKQAREPQKTNFWARLFSKAEQQDLAANAPARPTFVGVPGVDTDLHVWGRPFFIDAPTPKAACEGLNRYLDAVEHGPEAIDAIVRDMLTSLHAKRGERPAGVLDKVWARVAAAAPITSITPKPEEAPAPFDKVREGFRRQTQLWRLAMAAPDPSAELDLRQIYGPWEDRDDEPMTAENAQLGMPHDIVGFMSALTPGWMGRGYGFGSFLLDKINVTEAIFESPAAPFAPLAKHAPAMNQAFHTTIPCNYELGGYIPPERVGRFIEILEERRTDLILAFDDSPREDATTEHIEAWSADWRKIREAAEYARAKGWGYIEGAEIYSGPLGWMN